MGSLAAIPLVLICSTLPSIWYWNIVLILFLIGIKICDIASRDLGEHDHSGIVWDEIVGMFVTFLFVTITPLTLILGFLLFRVFDIAKPWPIGVLDQKVNGGLGIMIDDIVAGIMAALLLWTVVQFI